MFQKLWTTRICSLKEWLDARKSILQTKFTSHESYLVFQGVLQYFWAAYEPWRCEKGSSSPHTRGTSYFRKVQSFEDLSRASFVLFILDLHISEEFGAFFKVIILLCNSSLLHRRYSCIAPINLSSSASLLFPASSSEAQSRKRSNPSLLTLVLCKVRSRRNLSFTLLEQNFFCEQQKSSSSRL